MIAVLEVTNWDLGFQPNHIYLVDGDKAHAYIPYGKGEPRFFASPMRLDRARRKFKELSKNPFGDVKPQANLIKIMGSKGDTYFVDPAEGTCTCPGFKFRGACKHLKDVIG